MEPKKTRFLPLLITSIAFLAFNQWLAPRRAPQEIIEKPLKTAPVKWNEGRTFALKNESIQYIFDEKSASIIEANLPHTPLVKKSLLDQKLLDSTPEQAVYPSLAAHLPQGETLAPSQGGYTPLLRKNMPAYLIVSSEGKPLDAQFKMKSITEKEISFEGQVDGIHVTKNFTLPSKSSLLSCHIDFDTEPTNMWLTSGVPEMDTTTMHHSKLQYLESSKGKSKLKSLKLPKAAPTTVTTNAQWILNSGQFFGIMTRPLSQTESTIKALRLDGESVPTRLSYIDNLYPAEKFPGYELLLPLNNNNRKSMDFLTFMGPMTTSILGGIDSIIGSTFAGVASNFAAATASAGFFSSLMAPLTKLFVFLITSFHMLTGSWGIAIILLTIFLRLVIFPINLKSMRTMTRMNELQPEIARIKERYKTDPRKVHQESYALFKANNVNPFVASFLPLLIQFPLFIAISGVINSSLELRGASFIPGWINDLSAPDVLFTWSQKLWFIGNEFHLLPILIAVTMFIQQKITRHNMRNTQMTDQQKQQQSIMSFMSIAVIFFFYSMPSGMTLYFLISTILGLVQQHIFGKILKKPVGISM